MVVVGSPIFYGVRRTSAFEAWVETCVLDRLGLQVAADLAIHWGVAAPSTKASVRVPRDPRFLESPDRLKHAVTRTSPAYRAAGVGSRIFDFDVLSWVGWWLSRDEEYRAADRDAHGRFPSTVALGSRLGLAEIPVVDRLVDQLRMAVLESASEAGIEARRTIPWPPGRDFAVCLTHDVDHLASRSGLLAGRKIGGALLTSRSDGIGSRRLLREGWALLRGPKVSPYWLAGPMAQEERSRGFRSAFYVLPLTSRRAREGENRAVRYSIRSRDARSVFRKLGSEGWEIGLHSSYGALDMPGQLAAERSLVRESLGPAAGSIAGHRSHYLRFRFPQSLRQVQDAGVEYDSSLGWAAGWGFRTGTTMPYQLFDLVTETATDVWELGLTVMDVALPSAQEMLCATQEALDAAERAGGLAVLLYHPSPPHGMSREAFMDLYRAVLDDIQRRVNAWVALPSDVVEAMKNYRGRFPHGGDHG